MILFTREESGATLIEYGIALIVAIIIGGTTLVTLAGQTSTNLVTACGSLVVVGVTDNC